MISLARVLKETVDEKLALAIHQALSAWVENEREFVEEENEGRHDVEIDAEQVERLESMEKLVGLLDAEIAKLAEMKPEPDPEKIRRALLVMVLDAKHREWMKEHDPQALKQAEESLAQDLDFTAAVERGSVSR